MRRMMTGVVLMALAAGCATARADGKKHTTTTHDVIITHDDDGNSQNRTVEVRVEDDKIVKFIVNGKEVDPDSIDWNDGFLRYTMGDGDNDNVFFFSPDDNFNFSSGDNGEGFAFGNTSSGDHERAVLGVQVEEAPDGGIFIVELTDGGAAKEAGLHKGDIIVRIDGNEAGEISVLLHALEGKVSGDKMKLMVKRGGDMKKIIAKLKSLEGDGRNFAFFNENGKHAPRAQFRGREGNWAVVAPEVERRVHTRVLKEHLGDLRERNLKMIEKLGDGGVFELRGMEGLEQLHKLKGLEGLQEELLELKMLGKDGGAFAWSFRNGDSTCECDCDGCEDCQAGGTTRSWAPKITDDIRKRMHVELLERGNTIIKRSSLSKNRLIELETNLKHAHKVLENIEIDFDMPEIEVLIERLDGSGGNVVFVPDAPKMRSHFKKHNRGKNKHVDGEVAPRLHTKRLHLDTDNDTATKLEKESRAARLEARLERLEEMLEKLLRERDSN